MNCIDEIVKIINYYDNDELWYEFQLDKAVAVMEKYQDSDWESFYNELPAEDETINVRLLECMFELDEQFPARHVAKIAINAPKDVLLICIIKLNSHFVTKMDRDSLKVIFEKANGFFKGTETERSKIYAERIKSIEKHAYGFQ